MSFRYTGRVPLPPPNAERYTTTCQFCNVGCGYDVYVWPAGVSGGPKPGEHGIVYKVVDEVYGRTLTPEMTDFSPPLPALSAKQGRPWISEAMVVRTIRRDWSKGRGTGEFREVYVAQIPSPECPINMGDHSIRGGTNGERNWSPWNVAGLRRLKFPMVRFGGRLEVVTWDYAIDLVARVVKGVIDRWGIERPGWGKEGHAVFAHRMDHGGGGGGAMIENTAAGLFFFYGVRTAFARIHNRPFFGPENPAIGDAGPGAMNNSLHDLRLADVIIFWGANPYTTGTVMFIEHALDNLRGATAGEKQKWFSQGEPAGPAYMIIVDPRDTETARAAKVAGGDRVLVLRPEPGTDIVLANAIARVIYEKYRDVVENYVKHYRDAAQKYGFKWDENAWRLYLEKALEINKPLDAYLADAEKITGVSRGDIEAAARIIAEPKQGGYLKRVWLMYEKGIIWNQNYRSIYALVDLCIAVGAFRGVAGTGCQRQGGHQEGYAGPEPPPPPWEKERHHVSPWNFAKEKGIALNTYDDYVKLFEAWYDEVYRNGYYKTKWPIGDKYMPTTDFRLTAGEGKVLWVHDMDNYKLAPQAQRLKAAVSERAWRVTRYVFAEDFAKIGGAESREQYDVKVLDVPVTTRPTSKEYAERVLEALEKTGGLFIIVQDIYPTFMMEDAHMVLPAAFNNGEVPDVRMSVHERRFRIADAWLDPPGEAKPDWWIYAMVAKRIVELYEEEGRGNDPVAQRFRRAFQPIWDAMEKNARDPTVEVENEIFKTYIANADETYGKLGVGWEVQYWTPAFKKLDLNILRKFRTVGVVLPLTELKIGADGTVEARGVVNLMEPALNDKYREEVVIVNPDGTIIRRIEYQPSEKARDYVVKHLRAWPALWLGYPPYVAEQRSKYKYWVVNGRYNEIWQTGYADPNSEVLIRRWPYAFVQINSNDARREGVQSGDVVVVYSDNGSVPAIVWVTDMVKEGHIFLIMAHPYSVGANAVTTPSVEPVAQNPDYKLTAANIQKIGALSEEVKNLLTFRDVKLS
ncbi:molybdopterin dinucleotide binding domain-containing protein [Pyrobaculum ferrireducens]|uniref:Molybdopterin dinucleotide-binding region n=1 Tax=Pyrobaculum ferrireducens TaxID=1104324 RepID=G7VHF8_9CREN|nr:molybdopterin dinucleotide binding domain-containing protein [Pyrobaculum ferrireducens]AET33249.1 molybdopterin dinucleotide-binding region [Pyrobaculum ferrireducens]